MGLQPFLGFGSSQIFVLSEGYLDKCRTMDTESSVFVFYLFVCEFLIGFLFVYLWGFVCFVFIVDNNEIVFCRQIFVSEYLFPPHLLIRHIIYQK